MSSAKERSKKWRDNPVNKCKVQRIERNSKLKSSYGISIHDYEVMLIAQGNRCAICGSKSPKRKPNKHFAVDHDHRTGRVRGLLCHPCNAALGGFGESTLHLAKAITYLEDRS